jgi:mono/diheme cytochrome c family protein
MNCKGLPVRTSLLCQLICLALVFEFWLGAKFLATHAWAQEAHTFKQSVAPILQMRCISCHNSTDRKGDLSLQTRDELLGSGYVEPGQPENSQLLSVLLSHEGKKPTMPKSGEPLTEAEVGAIKAWIEAGAEWPNGVSIEEPVVIPSCCRPN